MSIAAINSWQNNLSYEFLKKSKGKIENSTPTPIL